MSEEHYKDRLRHRFIILAGLVVFGGFGMGAILNTVMHDFWLSVLVCAIIIFLSGLLNIND